MTHFDQMIDRLSRKYCTSSRLRDFENSDVFFKYHKTATFKAAEKLSIEDVAVEKASSPF